jgi:hypothetical protein
LRRWPEPPLRQERPDTDSTMRGRAPGCDSERQRKWAMIEQVPERLRERGAQWARLGAELHCPLARLDGRVAAQHSRGRDLQPWGQRPQRSHPAGPLPVTSLPVPRYRRRRHSDHRVRDARAGRAGTPTAGRCARPARKKPRFPSKNSGGRSWQGAFQFGPKSSNVLLRPVL